MLRKAVGGPEVTQSVLVGGCEPTLLASYRRALRWELDPAFCFPPFSDCSYGKDQAPGPIVNAAPACG